MGSWMGVIMLTKLKPIYRPVLPLIFVLDTSGSMVGEKIGILNNALFNTIQSLNLHFTNKIQFSIRLNVLEFNTTANWMYSDHLVPVEEYVFSPMKAGGLTCIGNALGELADKLSTEENGFLKSETGLFAPIIVFATDGEPDDVWESSNELLHENGWYKNSIRVGFGLGPEVHLPSLARIIGMNNTIITITELNEKNLYLFKSVFRQIILEGVNRILNLNSNEAYDIFSQIEEGDDIKIIEVTQMDLI